MAAESRHADTSWLLSLCAARMGASMMFLSYPAVLPIVQREMSPRAALIRRGGPGDGRSVSWEWADCSASVRCSGFALFPKVGGKPPTGGDPAFPVRCPSFQPPH